MRNKEDTSIGKYIYLYFEGKSAKVLRAKRRPKKNGVLIRALVVETSTKKKKPKIIAVCSKKYFADESIYGGHGIKLDAEDVHIITQAEFNDFKTYTDEVIDTICKENGFSTKKFIAAYKKYNKDKEASKKSSKSKKDATPKK